MAGKLMDLDQRLTTGEFCLSPKCARCGKKEVKHVIRCAAVQGPPVTLMLPASPLTVQMTKMSLPDSSDPEKNIDVFAFMRCLDSPCMLSQLHDIVMNNYIMDLKQDFEASQRAKMAMSKSPKGKKRKAARKKRSN